MANSFQRFTGDGATTQFPVTFPYLNRDHIAVRVDGVEDTAFTWVSDTQVETSTIPASGAIVEVRRTTPTDPLTDFVDGSTLAEVDLDRVLLQSLYVMQEAEDRLGGLIEQDATGQWNVEGLRLTNVANPVNDQDAATLAHVRDQYNSGIDAGAAQAAAEAARDLAIAARDKAQLWAEQTVDVEVETGQYSALHHATKAGESAVAAATSETNAGTSATEAENWANYPEDSLVPEGDGVDDYSALHHARKAEASAAAASTSEGNAATSAGNAATSETNSAASEAKAEQWANAPAGTEVEAGKYSALHYAEQAATFDPAQHYTRTEADRKFNHFGVGKNFVDNAQFDVEDRREWGAFTVPFWPADRWYLEPGGGSEWEAFPANFLDTVGRDGVVPRGISRYLRCRPRVAGTGGTALSQRISGHHWLELTNKTVTLSAWVRADTDTTLAGFGRVWNEYENSFSGIYPYEVVPGTTVSVGTTWTRVSYSFTAPVISDNATRIVPKLYLTTNLDGSLVFDTAQPPRTDIIITGVQLEIGAEPTENEYVDPEADRRRCYFWYVSDTYGMDGVATGSGQKFKGYFPALVPQRDGQLSYTVSAKTRLGNCYLYKSYHSGGLFYDLTSSGAGTWAVTFEVTMDKDQGT